MATDRLTYSSQARDQNNPPAHVSRMFSNARYVLNSRHLVGQGASEASGIPCYHWVAGGLLIRRPRACRESIDSRDQLTQASVR